MTSWGPFDVSGKRVLVTGGALGIGLGIARRFVEGGASVLLVDLDEAALAKARTQLSGIGRVATLVADVSADGADDTIVSRCVRELGGLDVLVNNAGIFPQIPMLKMTSEEFDRVYRVNLRGLAFLSKAAGLQFVQQGKGGVIVNIGSVDSVHPSMVGLAAYDASKGGVLMFTKNFALEMAPHRVRVNAILPGAVRTEGTSRPLEGSGMTDAQQTEMLERFVQAKVPLRRMGVPDDIGKVAVFLASPAAEYMTGSAVTVDGGLLLT